MGSGSKRMSHGSHGSRGSHGAHGSQGRRPSICERRSRQNSVLSMESSSSFIIEENNHEMYSGAASEIIPSSITSLHYPHHLRGFRNRDGSSTSREISPLLATSSEPVVENFDLESVKSGASSKRSLETQVGFRFFSPDEIEEAPGGSTLENPYDPVDYNTAWDYSVDKYEEDQGQGPEEGASDVVGSFGSGRRAYDGSLSPPKLGLAEQSGDNQSTYGSINSSSMSQYERHLRHGSDDDSDKSDSLYEESTGYVESMEELKDYPTVSEYQRYYLAEEDLVIGIAGYKNSPWKRHLYYLICIVTLGVGFLILRWFPKYRVNLMGDRSPLGKADWCVIENEFGELVIVDVKKQRFDQRLSNFLNISDGSKPDDEDKSVRSKSTIDHLDKRTDPVIPRIHHFTYRYLKFFYNPTEDIFKTNSNWYDNHWLNIKNTKDGISQSTQAYREEIFGENNIDIKEKPITQLLLDEVLHPFYVFQVFSIILWALDSYYYYAGCIFTISLISIVNTLVETKSTIKRLKEVSVYSCEVRVWRNEFWKQIDSNELVPGDVFEVDPSLSTIPCDALLVNGECVVNESMLTGESVPVSKVCATSETVHCLKGNFTTPLLAKSYLYNGTKLLKMKTANEEPVMAMVLKTGFNTTKGSLVRSMLFPKPTGFKFYEDSFKYIGFMSLIALLGFIYSTYNFINLGVSKKIMLLRALDIITIVVPPALPATLTIGTTFAMNRLRKREIFCIAPTRVNIGGKLDVICFDKTGTLTEDGLDVLGLHLADNASGRKEIIFKDLVQDINFLYDHLNDDRRHDTRNGKYFLGGLATCHSLRLIEDELLGDPLDAKMFEFTKWHLKEEHNGGHPIVYPKYESEGYMILKEYEFISNLRRMSVLVKDGSEKRFVFTKGAPEVMINICKEETLPQNFEELLHHYTHSGFRVIAMAYKPLKGDRESADIPREEIEADLIFSGFIVFENKIKEKTIPTLKVLNEAKIRNIMCTGDNILTAISVANDCGLVGSSVERIYLPIFQEGCNDTNIRWEEFNDPQDTLDPTLLQPVNSNIRSEINLSENDTYKLAMTGDVFRYLLTDVKNTQITQQVLMKCDIFARMSPDEKHELVEQLQKIDYTVGFCGDGANDCGALKAADVGISLSEAEASVAAPFTSRVFEISCVLDVIKEGRSSLVTSFSCFKYMSLYSAIQFITVTILYKRGVNLGDFQFLYIDMFLILPLAIVMSWSKPYKKIVIKRPTANLVSPKVLVPLCLHILVLMVFQVALWLYVQQEPYYIKPVPSDDDENVKCFDNTVLFLFTNFQYILIAAILSAGPPYREPVLKNKPFVINLVASILISLSLFSIEGDSWWGNFMQLTDLSTGFYWLIMLATGLNFAVMYIGEKSWFQSVVKLYKKVFRRYSVARSKKTFKNLKREYVSLQSV